MGFCFPRLKLYIFNEALIGVVFLIKWENKKLCMEEYWFRTLKVKNTIYKPTKIIQN